MDSQDEDEDECMDSQDEEEINLVDIAKIPSQIHATVPPSHMLEAISAPYIAIDGKCYYGNPVMVAIANDDFEAFVQLMDVYKSLPQTVIPPSTLNTLIAKDRPAMLDEYIRRTGQGIELKKELRTSTITTTTDHDDNEDGDGHRVYLGLNVHGKKRKDLANKGDGQGRHGHYQSMTDIPMLWQAAQSGSVAVVRYLASEQPLAAYKFYASSHGDAKAKMLRRIPDLAAVLPDLLGWVPSALNESVITHAIYGGKLNILEALSSMRPKDTDTALHLKCVHIWFCAED
jgi:hypothetical protein